MMPTGIVVIVSAFFALIGIIISKENKVSEFRQKWIDELRTDISSAMANATRVQGIALDIAYYSNLITKIVKAKSELEEVEDTQRSISTHEAQEPRFNAEPLRFKYDQKAKRIKQELNDCNKRLEKRLKDLEDRFLTASQEITSIGLRINKKECNFLHQLDVFDVALKDFYHAIRTSRHEFENDDFILKQFQLLETSKSIFTSESKELLKREWEVVKKGEKVFNWVIKGLAGVLVLIVLSELPQIKKSFISDSISKSEITLRVIEETPETKQAPTETK